MTQRVLLTDHLDVVGHYGDPDHATTDWLPAATGFDRVAFRDTWSKIVDHQIGAARELSREDVATRDGVSAG